jgi:UDPglucose 6-dehydrogenase
MRVVVIGAGYVGLVSGACLAEIGHEVTCVDSDAARIAALSAGQSPIHEPGLEALLARAARAGRLVFAGALPDLSAAQLVFMAVGAPPRPDDGSADLGELMAAVDELAPALSDRAIVVVKSTVPPGTADLVEARLRALRPDLLAVVVSNPEFLREGAAIEDFLAPDRIVVGSDSPIGCQALDELYQPITARGAPILFVDRRTAELTKYAANAFLAAKIGFINEIADLCEALGADVAEVARGMGLDRRIGGDSLEAGPGFGGSRSPKDLRALLALAAEVGTELGLVAQTESGNAARKAGLADRVARALGGELKGRRIAVLGLTYKPNTDDMREAPALALIAGLKAAGARVNIHDPQAADPYACAKGADALVVVSDWSQLRRLNAARLAQVMRGRTIVDLRNALNAGDFTRAGFVVHPVGRPPRGPEGARRASAASGARPATLVPARLKRFAG